MKFGEDIAVDRRADIPRLAWAIFRSADRMRLTCGSGVQVTPTRISEGVHVPSASDEQRAVGALSFGTAVDVDRGSSLLFSPPSHCFEYIYLLRDRRSGSDVFSNSLCFILRQLNGLTRMRLVGKASEFNVNFHAATAIGAAASGSELMELEGSAVSLFTVNQFRVDLDGRWTMLPAPPNRLFRDYEDYKAGLRSALVDIFHKGRRATPAMDPIVAISRGYDSVAVAALASTCGLKDALTFDVGVKQRSDNGSDIARQLGLTVVEHAHVLSRNIYPLRREFEGDLSRRALEFIASGGVGDDVCFAEAEESLRDRILLTGAWGDSIWDIGSSVGSGLPVRIPFGKSLSEFRLRVGFTHVPVPTIAAFDPAPIQGISQSEEMAPFSVGGVYDRPIPRRLAEEQGVPRGAFGLKKRAIAPFPINHEALWPDAVMAVGERYPKIDA